MSTLNNAPVANSSYGYDNQDNSRRVKGIVIVVAIHLVIGYVLVSGLARKGLNLIKKPLEAVVIQEVIIPRLHRRRLRKLSRRQRRPSRRRHHRPLCRRQMSLLL